MVNHSSASLRETPHLSAAIKRRAQSLSNDNLIDSSSRTIIRYGLETNDPWLGELVRRVDAGETIVDNLSVTSDDEKLETLTGLICRSGDEPATKSAALLVLMSTLENSAHAKALANIAKHFAFNHYSHLNVHNMLDTQIAALSDDLFSTREIIS